MNVGVTGHRTLSPGATEWVQHRIDDLLARVPPPIVGITALAEGADQLFAARVLACGGSLRVVVPFADYPSRLPDAASREEFARLLAEAETTEVLGPFVDDEAGYAAAGRRVVDLSDRLVAVWDGLPARGRGGTAEIVDYARAHEIPVVQLDPDTRTVKGDDTRAADAPRRLDARNADARSVQRSSPMDTRVVTATVMFTDQVGSTAQRTSLGDDAADVLTAEYDRLLRDIVAAHAGSVVKSTGDGVLAVFDAALDGVRAAVEIQRAAVRHNRQAPPERHLVIRIGLSAGDVSFTTHDCHGTPVVEAARLEAAATAGEIWVSDLVRRLVGSRGSESFTEIGPIELKGLAPVVVHRAEWDDRAANTATPRSAPPAHPGRVARESLHVPLPVRLEATGPVVGRAAHIGRLEAALEAAAATQHRRIAVAIGEAGIGKTTLAATFARHAFADGAVVLYGRCDEDLGVPYQPWSEALTYLARHAPATVPVAGVAGRAAPLRRLLTDPAGPAPVPAPTDPDTERVLLFASVVDTLAELSARAPVVLILDDLHVADEGTLLLLHHVAGAEARLRVLVLGLVRSEAVPANPRLADLLAGLYRESGVERITLTGLDADALLDLLEAQAGHPLDDDGRRLRDLLLEETSGNPFFVSETLRHLAETGVIGQDDDGHWRAHTDIGSVGLPPTVRDVITRRVARLGAEVERILGLAAVIGRDFTLSLLSEVGNVDEDQLLDHLELATAAALIRTHADQPDAFGFVHALVEKTLYDGLSPIRRLRAHRRIADVLAAAVGDPPDERISELARHAIAAEPAGDDALRFAELAASRAESVLAPQDAVRWLETALEVVGRRGNDEHDRARVLVQLGEAQRLAGDSRSRDNLLTAAALARRSGDREILIRAGLANTRGFASQAGAVDRDVVAVLRDAVAAAGDAATPERARLLATLAAELAYEPDWRHRKALSDEALTIARALDDDATLSYVLGRRANTLWVPDLLEERLAASEENLAVADRLQDPIARFWAVVYRMFNVLMAGDVNEIDTHLQTMQTIADEVPVPALQWELLQQRACLAVMRGEYEDGERLALEAYAIAHSMGQADADGIMAGQLFLARLDRGLLDDVVDLLAQAAHDHPGITGLRAALAVAYCAVGRATEAAAMLRIEADGGFGAIGYDQLWHATLTEWAMVAEHVGDADAAARLRDLLAPWEGQVAFTGAHVFGPVALPLGLCAATTGDHDAALNHLARAAREAEAIGAPAWTGRALTAAARTHRRRDAGGDTGRAIELAEQAIAVTRAVGADGVGREARVLLEHARGD